VLLGQRVKEIRKNLGLTQAEICKKIKFSPGYLSEIEHGEYNPTFMFYFNLAKKLNVNLEYLFFGKGRMFKKQNNDTYEINERFGDDARDIKEMLLDIEHSPFVKHTILGDYRLLKIEKENTIKKDIQQYQKKHKSKNGGKEK
jgi:putative transcriptional regulator